MRTSEASFDSLLNREIARNAPVDGPDPEFIVECSSCGPLGEVDGESLSLVEFARYLVSSAPADALEDLVHNCGGEVWTHNIHEF